MRPPAQVPALVARYAGSPDLLAKVEEAVRVQQDLDYAVAVAQAAAKILEKVLLGSSIADALEWAASDDSTNPELLGAIREALDSRSKPLAEVVKVRSGGCKSCSKLPVGSRVWRPHSRLAVGSWGWKSHEQGIGWSAKSWTRDQGRV